MRFILIFLLSFQTAFGQMYFGRIPSVETTPPTIPGQRTLIYDEFEGGTLNSRWNVRRPDKTTISVGSGLLTMSVNTDTMPEYGGRPYSNLTSQALLYDTSYGLTAIRNYTEEIKFRPTKINDTTLGAILGVYSPFPLDWMFTNFAIAQFCTADSIQYLAGRDTAFSVPPAFKEPLSTFSFNTTDWFIFRHTNLEGSILITFKNLTTGDSINKYYARDFVNGSYPSRPNYFYFGFGGVGRTSMQVDYILVTTPEELNPRWLVVSDSRGTGFNAGSADSAYGNMLKRNTTDSVQIFAGGGMNTASILLVLYKILYEINPERVILDFGTNNEYNSTFQTQYQQITDSLDAHGIIYYVMYQPNGGDPITGGSKNQWLHDNYTSHIIDNWTDPGYATKTIGNGMMHDGVHETLLGMQTTYAIIKAALIAFFPL